MQPLKQSTAATVLVGPVLDSTGAAYTGMAIGDFNITKNGTTAAMAATATATHSHEGHYLIALTTGNSDTLGRLDISCNKSTYAMPPGRFEVLTATAFDTLVTNGTLASTTSGRTITVDASGNGNSNLVNIAGSAVNTSAAQLGVNVVNFGGSAGTFASGRPEVNTTHAAGTAWGSGAITSGAFAAGAITASAIAADAIGASELATDAVTEIAAAVWNSAMASYQTAGTMGLAVNELDTIYQNAYDGITARLLANVTHANGTLYSTAITTPLGAVKTKTDQLTFTVANVVDSNTTQWKGSTAPAMTGDAYARLGAPVGASISADIAGVPAALLDLTDGIESGVTLRKAIRAIAAKSAGLVTGAGTGTEVVKGIGQSSGGTTRLTATVDSSGNISNWGLNL